MPSWAALADRRLIVGEETGLDRNGEDLRDARRHRAVRRRAVRARSVM
jgi:hypothetical protein